LYLHIPPTYASRTYFFRRCIVPPLSFLARPRLQTYFLRLGPVFPCRLPSGQTYSTTHSSKPVTCLAYILKKGLLFRFFFDNGFHPPPRSFPSSPRLPPCPLVPYPEDRSSASLDAILRRLLLTTLFPFGLRHSHENLCFLRCGSSRWNPPSSWGLGTYSTVGTPDIYGFPLVFFPCVGFMAPRPPFLPPSVP